MEPTRYFIKGQTYAAADPGLQDALARVYGSPERPRCLCMSGGIEMYISRHAEYVVKRMPDTGNHHHPTCPSFEPEPGISGLGELVGQAIIEHTPDQVEIRTDFAMSRMPGKSVPRGEAVTDPAEGHAPRKRMSLLALLHFLYERAGFNRWFPAMEGRRNQGVLHKYLIEAARGVMVKGVSLVERLYVPEPFRAELKDEIGQRRRRKLALLLSPEDAVQFKMAIIVGEYNGSEQTNFGRRIVVKHMPDVPLFIETKDWERIERNFAGILQARDADVPRKPRVMMAALVYAKREHVYQVERVSMMLTTDQWIPLNGLHELPLIELLHHEQRAFMKPLRYDARSAAGFPNVLLLDSGKVPVQLHVVSPFMEAKERSTKEKLLAGIPSAWVWATDQDMPHLPERKCATEAL
ncbi:MAG: DUF1173 family protein [Rubrivivax sp.]|nr:DUF1173 family protein [Rubrivivax sp.]